ncbi:hypothetical protein L3X38_033580 [Prunus dulcis]|uniref:Uncharacterized protein n=1 Tax=Prunus dulcis TaxID=3755 RepID=A0AAD4VHW2_PRUDU|nr:hypothetical protein L3X38_033580 [Prunus dulcis]
MRGGIAARIEMVSLRPARGDCSSDRRGISETCEGDCGPDRSGISETCEGDCGPDRSGISEACEELNRWLCTGCGPNRSGISEACEELNRWLFIGCGPDRSGISEACEDRGSACEEGIDSINGVDGSRIRGKNYVWLDPSVRVRRQPSVTRCSHEGVQGPSHNLSGLRQSEQMVGTIKPGKSKGKSSSRADTVSTGAKLAGMQAPMGQCDEVLSYVEKNHAEFCERSGSARKEMAFASPIVVLNETPLHDATTLVSPLESPMNQDSPIQGEPRLITIKAAKAKRGSNSINDCAKFLAQIALNGTMRIEKDMKRDADEKARDEAFAREMEYAHKQDV